MKKNEKLKELFESTIDTVIKFKLGLDVYQYQEDKHLKNYRDFEEELAINYPIKGTKVAFGREILSNWKSIFHNHLIINSNKLLDSSDITETLSWNPFPQEQMVLVYLFTILEDFGNSIVEIVNPSLHKTLMENDRSWHGPVNKHARSNGQDLVKKFAEPFQLERSDVDEKFVELLFDLKQKRNSIAHEMRYPENNKFETDFESLIILICYIYHINDPEKEDISYFPWHDWEIEMGRE